MHRELVLFVRSSLSRGKQTRTHITKIPLGQYLIREMCHTLCKVEASHSASPSRVFSFLCSILTASRTHLALAGQLVGHLDSPLPSKVRFPTHPSRRLQPQPSRALSLPCHHENLPEVTVCSCSVISPLHSDLLHCCKSCLFLPLSTFKPCPQISY